MTAFGWSAKGAVRNPGEIGHVDANETEIQRETVISGHLEIHMSNVQINWVLEAYLPRVAGVADHQRHQAALSAIIRRARFEAMLRGVRDESVVEDAVSAMLTWAAGSQITQTFRPDRGTAKRYINKIIARYLQKEIGAQWRQASSLAGIDAASSVADPAKEAEMRDLAEACERRLGTDFGKPDLKGSPDEAPSRRYNRGYRHRKRRWKEIADLFEGHPRRVRKRPSGR
jgi:hypothetical protein